MDLIDRNTIEYQYLPTDTIGNVFITTDTIGNVFTTKSKIDQIPSVEIPHWVSIDERLPDKEGQYICCIRHNFYGLSDDYELIVYNFCEDFINVYSVDDKFINDREPGFYYCDPEQGGIRSKEVVFWLEGLELPVE